MRLELFQIILNFSKKSESILCDKLSRLVTNFVKRHKANEKKKITINGILFLDIYFFIKIN